MRRLNNQLKTILLLGVLSAVLIAVGGALGTNALYAATALALLLNVGAYFFSDRIVLRLHGAQEIAPIEAPHLHQLVGELAYQAGIPKPRLFLIDGDHANAFATGRNPANAVVAVTRPLVALLTTGEIRAVLAHELAHIKNRDILVCTIAAAIAAAVTYAAQAIQLSAFFGAAHDHDEEHGSGLLVALVAPIAATLIQLGMSRSREFMADETGVRISGDPLALASALQKLERRAELAPAGPQPATASLFIVNPLTRSSRWVNLFSTHPSTEERVRRLRTIARTSHRLAA